MPKTKPSAAARRGDERPTRQASSAMAMICSGQRSPATKAIVCSAPSAAKTASSTSGRRRTRTRRGRRAGRVGGGVAQAPSDPSASSAARVTLNQRTAPPRASITEKTQPADRHRLAAPRHPAELVRDQAADGLELVGRQDDVERLVDRRERRVAGDALAAVGERVDARLGVVLVELVLDLADDLLEHVLDREQAGGVAELVDDDGDVVAVGAEVAQQVVERLRLGDEERRPQQRAQVEVGRALQLQQVLGHQDADDVVAPLLEHRKARVAGVDDDVQHLLERRVDVEQVHVAARDHDVAGGHVGHPDHALEHHPRLGLDQLLVLGVGERLDQLVARVRAGRDEVEELLEERAFLGRAAALSAPRGARAAEDSDMGVERGRAGTAEKRNREAYRSGFARSLTGLLP